MNIGTKSVLYGAHCAIIHPWFLAVAWWKLYRLPLGRPVVGQFLAPRHRVFLKGATWTEPMEKHMSSLAPESWRCSLAIPGEPSQPPIRAIGRSGTDGKSPAFAWPTNWPSC